MNAANQILDDAITAARLGGEVLLHHHHNGFGVQKKSRHYDLVTDADVEAERVITEFIRQTYPDHEILAEEGHTSIAEQSRAEHLWIIDPLDGTNNFAHGVPHYAVSIAYYQNGIPETAAVLNPVRNDLFTAAKGTGAWHNGESISVGEQTELSDVLVGVGFYYDRGAMMQATLKTVEALFAEHIHGIRRFGTAALDLCHVATGMYGAFFEYQLSPWDFAAGRLIVEEAGGKVTTAAGENLPIASSTVLATNGALHGTMLKVIRQTAYDVI